jgi:hypothetical protein
VNYKRIFFVVLMNLYPVVAFSQPGFDFLFWNQSGGIIESPSISVSQIIEEHWHDQLLPSILSIHVKTHTPKSIQIYMQMIERLQPICIEGDPAFVELEVNQQRQQPYLPILQSNSAQNAELIFRSSSPNWQGVLGVIHPSYNPGGRLQIQRWQQETGTAPEIHTFYSTEEVLMHLMVGSIEAAAVPQSALDEFLQSHNHSNLAENFYRIPISNPLPATMIFLRQDWYTDIRKRTLITETWLRDALPNHLQIAPQALSFLSSEN